MNTPDKATEIKAAAAAVLAFFTALWGWLGWAVLLLIVCMALDWITGSWAAHRRGEWSSAVARDGLWHKLGEIVALLVAALCDIAVQVILESTAADLLAGWTYGNYMTMLVCVWYIFTELGSIIENADKLGGRVPPWLRKGIAALQRRADAADPTLPDPEPAPDPKPVPDPEPLSAPVPATARASSYEDQADAAADPDFPIRLDR